MLPSHSPSPSLLLLLLLLLLSPLFSSTTLFARALDDSARALDDSARALDDSARALDDSARALDDSVLTQFLPISYDITPTMALADGELQRIQTSAESGSATSAYALGLSHLYGLGDLPASPLSSIKYFRSAAIMGNPDACCALGLLLYYGAKDVGRDTKSAIAWFRKAADAGHGYGLWLLGRGYYEGRVGRAVGGEAASVGGEASVDGEAASSTPPLDNFAEAARYFGLASEAGVKEAMHHLGVMYEYGLIQASDDESPALPPRDNSNGNGNGNARKFQPNFKRAMQVYTEAYDLEYAESGYNLALMMAYGRGTTQDFTGAMEIFRKCSVELNHAGSMRYLGIFNVNGHGLPNSIPNYRDAVYWFDMCAKSEDDSLSDTCGRERDELKKKVNEAEAEVRRRVEGKNFENIDIDITTYEL